MRYGRVPDGLGLNVVCRELLLLLPVTDLPAAAQGLVEPHQADQDPTRDADDGKQDCLQCFSRSRLTTRRASCGNEPWIA